MFRDRFDRNLPPPRPRPGDLILCETSAAIITHLRILGPDCKISYSGHWPRPIALCEAEIAWDVRSPPSDCRCFDCQIAVVFLDHQEEWGTCRGCFQAYELVQEGDSQPVVRTHSYLPTRMICKGSKHPPVNVKPIKPPPSRVTRRA